MKYALIALAVIAAIVLVAVVVGASLPIGHRVSRQVKLHQPAESVFTAINDPASFPSWRSKVKRVEIVKKVETLPDHEGHRRFRETGGDGTILYEVEREIPNKLLVTRIADETLPFG